MCPGTTAYRRHTLKDQTDREEHCSTLVGLASALLPKYHSHHLGLYLYLYLYSACPKPGSVHVPLVGFDTQLTLWCGDVVWCDVIDDDVPGCHALCLAAVKVMSGDLRAVEPSDLLWGRPNGHRRRCGYSG
jgi:hypothetical protein